MIQTQTWLGTINIKSEYEISLNAILQMSSYTYQGNQEICSIAAPYVYTAVKCNQHLYVNLRRIKEFNQSVTEYEIWKKLHSIYAVFWPVLKIWKNTE